MRKMTNVVKRRQAGDTFTTDVKLLDLELGRV